MFRDKKKKGSLSSDRVKTYRKNDIALGETRSFFTWTRKNQKNSKKSEVVHARQDSFFHYSYYLLLILFVGAALYMFLFSPGSQIRHIELSGTKDIPVEDILLETNIYLSGNYFSFLSKRNFSFFRKESYEQYIQEGFPKIRTLQVTKKFPQTLLVHIEERESLMIWCSAGMCYMLDEYGHAYEREEELSYAPSLSRVRIIDQSGHGVLPGDEVLTRDLLELYSQLYAGLPDVIDVSLDEKFIMKQNIAQEVEVRTQEGWTIRLSTNLSAEQSLRTLKTYFEKEFLNKEDREKLEYVDVRVENKVFSKLKDEYLEKEGNGDLEEGDENEEDENEEDKNEEDKKEKEE